MRHVADSKNHRGLNAAQRLRSMLGLPQARSRAPVRPRRLHIEALEPRLLLSGEGLIIPPQPKPVEAQAAITVPHEQLAAQLQASTFDASAGQGQKQAATQQAQEVIFVDPSVQGYEALVNQALKNRGGPGAEPSKVEVVVLDANADGVQQITQWLAQRQGLQAIHLVSHGESGEIKLGTATLDNQTVGQYGDALAHWKQALQPGADLLIYGCDVAAGEQGASFIGTLSALTGADVAASTNATGSAAAGGDWLLESSTGRIETAALTDSSYAGVLALNATTLTLNAGLQTQIKAVLNKVDATATQALKNALTNTALPGLGDSVNKFIGLTATNGGTSGVFGLEAAANTYFTSNGAGANLQGLAGALQTAMAAALPSLSGQNWTTTVTPTFDPSAPEVVAGFNLSVSLGSAGWTKTGVSFTVGGGGWSGTANAKVAFDIDAGLVLTGVTAATSDPTAIATPSNSQSFFRFNRFGVALELTPTASNGFHLKAGVETTLADPDNSDGKSRITLAEFDTATSSGTNLSALLKTALTASIDGVNGGTGMYGQVASGALTLKTFADAPLDATGNGLKGILAGAVNLGSQVDALDDLTMVQPMAGSSMADLLKTSDGRSLGDVLGFKLPKGGTVLDDYLASAATPTLSGLLQRLRDYLTGSGVYSNLEALVASSYTSDFMNIGSTSVVAGNKIKLDLQLDLSRDFLSRFTFDGKLDPLGLQFMPESGVALTSTLGIDLVYDSNAGTLGFSKLQARVKTQSSAFDASMAMGILEGHATGSVTFDTGTLALEVGKSNAEVLFGLGVGVTHTVEAVTPSMVKAVSDGSFNSSLDGNVTVALALPQVSASADFNLTGMIGAGAAGATSFTALAGGVPHIAISFDGGGAINWSEIKAHPLQLTTSNFTALQPFASLDSVSLVNMLGDLGTYLQQLRDSGKFDALLPYTNLALGQTLDFSKGMTDIVGNQLQTILSSGAAGSSAISPVLASDVSFDVQVTRAGDTNPITVTIAITAAETAGFTNISQLAQLINNRIAAAADGNLRWQADNAVAAGVVTQVVEGGVAINSALTTSEEQKIDIHANTGTFTIEWGGAGGSKTISLAVDASISEVQHALQSLGEIGAGNVLVTGSPKHYIISFTGALAGTALPMLKVNLSDTSAANAGGLLDVLATNTFTGDDGKVWGILSVTMAVPSAMTDLRIAASGGVSLQTINAGSADADAVQRLIVVHAAGGSFTLAGTKSDGTAFKTAAISLDGPGAWSTRIQDALNLVLGTTLIPFSTDQYIPLDGTSGVTVTATDPNVIDLAAGTQSFDITFSGTAVGKKAVEPITPNASLLTTKTEAQYSQTTLKKSALAVGSTPATNEVQRISITNGASGDVAFGMTIGTKFFQSANVAWGSLGAASIQSALVAMFQQMDATFPANGVTVTAAPGKTHTWDIEFNGSFAGTDVPDLKVDISGVVAAADTHSGGATSFQLLDKLGFSINGADAQTTTVTTFVSFNDMMERFQQAVNDSLAGTGLSLSVNPRFDAASKSLLFDIKLAPVASTVATPLQLASSLGALSDLSAGAALEITSQTSFSSTIGFDLSSLNTFALRAGGAYTATIQAGGTTTAPKNFTVPVFNTPLTSTFSLAFNGESYSVTFTGSATLNTTYEQLAAQMQAALDAVVVTNATGLLGSMGYTTVGQAVKVKVASTNQRLQLVTQAPLTSFKIGISSDSDPLTTILGFRPMTVYPTAVQVTLPADGKLTADATFSLVFDNSTPVAVTVAKTATDDNTKLDDLIADINAAFALVDVSGNAYLGTGAGGRGALKLGDLVQAIVNSSQIELVTQQRWTASLGIQISGNSTASSELGFTPGQFARTGGADVFLQDASISGSYSGIVHGQVGSTPATLDAQGSAVLGMLDLTFDKISADYQGSMSFSLRNGTTAGAHDRVSLNSLFDSVSSQTAQLGMTGSLTTTDSYLLGDVPVLASGKLLRDVGLTVTVGTTVVNVIVRQSDTASNTTLADLAADVNAAIHSALLLKLGTNPYAGFQFATVDTTAGVSKLKFNATTSTLHFANDAAQIYDSSNGTMLADLTLSVGYGSTAPISVVVRKTSNSSNTSVAELADSIRLAIASAAASARSQTTDAQAIRNLNTIIAAAAFPISNEEGALVIGSAGDLSIDVATATAGGKSVNIDDNPELFYDSTNGRLLRDLTLTVTKSTTKMSAFTVAMSDTAAFTGVDQLVTLIKAKLAAAVVAQLAGASGTTQSNLLDLQAAMAGLPVTAPGGVLALGAANGFAVTPQDITLKTLSVAGRLLVDDFITTPVFGANTAFAPGATGPTASLTMSGIDITLPSGVSVSDVDPTTTISVGVSNLAAALAGASATAAIAVVPPTGLGVLTPLKDLSWSSIVADLAALPKLLGDMGTLGAYGELGRMLPLLGDDVGSLFGLQARLNAIQSALASASSISLNQLQGLLAAGFGVDPGNIALGLDLTSGQEALTIHVDYAIQLTSSVALKMMFSDPDFLALLSTADQAKLTALLGDIATMTDADGTALLKYAGTAFTLHLAMGIDLAAASANKGKLFLYDHASAGAAGLADDTGTFATFTLHAFNTNMAFNSEQGIYVLSVLGGQADVAESGSWVLDTVGASRLYLNAVNTMKSDALATAQKDDFQVTIDASSQATAKLPLSLLVSDDLAQLAMAQIDGFVNPLPLGTMDLQFLNLANTFGFMGGKAAATAPGADVHEANKPPRPPTTGNGTGDATAEGAPIDNATENVNPINLNPYVNSTDGQGATTDAALPSSPDIPATTLFGDGAANTFAGGTDLRYVLPDIAYWQNSLLSVLQKATGTEIDPHKPVNYALIFLLRDPTIIVNTVDKILEGIQVGLDAFSSVLNLPIIGDQLREATQFVADFRSNIVGSIRDALSSAVQVYGGLDNALRMFMFNTLTTDTNHDFIIEQSEINANPFRNFIRDYNGDGKITPDDIVVEYIAGTGNAGMDTRTAQYLGIQQAGITYNRKVTDENGNPVYEPDGSRSLEEVLLPIPGLLPGQRTAWVTSGINTPIPGSFTADGTQRYTISAGNVVMDQGLRQIVDDITGAIQSSGDALLKLAQTLAAGASSAGAHGTLDALVNLVIDNVGSGNVTYDSLLKDVFGGAVGLVAMQQAAKTFSPSDAALADAVATLKANIKNGSYDIPPVLMAEFKTALYEKAKEIATNMALQQSTAIQFRMNLGQTYTPNLDLSFDIGVPGLNLKLDGGIGLDLSWDFFFGFGIDIKDGFYLITNMPGTAGIGEVTNLAADGTVDANKMYVSNTRDTHIQNLWLVGKPTQTDAVKEIQFSVDVYLRGTTDANGNEIAPAKLNAEFLVLNGTLTDNWDGFIKDNDTGIWGDSSLGYQVGNTATTLGSTQTANYGRTTELFDGKTGKDGSRTQFHGVFTIDLKDKGLFGLKALSALTNGRLTYSDFRSVKASDLIKVEWSAKAQVNMHMKLGISLDGGGYLPAVLGDFHLTWQTSNKSAIAKKLDEFFSVGYDKLFHDEASIWISDVYLDMGSFFTTFLRPIVNVVNEVTDPIMPVINALETPIPGLSTLMGRDYSTIDLARDMSRLFGGNAEIDFIIELVDMIYKLHHLPDGGNMLLPVSEILILKGKVDRKLNLSVLKLPLPDIPVDLPYQVISNVNYDDGTVQVSVQAGVGWRDPVTHTPNATVNLTDIITGSASIPPISLDLDLDFDMRVPAPPYKTYTLVDVKIPDGVSGFIKDSSGNDALFKIVVGFGWTDLKLSDILSGNFAPRFDITVTAAGIDFNLAVLPPLKFVLPAIKLRAFNQDYVWGAGSSLQPQGAVNGVMDVDWPLGLQNLVDGTKTPVTFSPFGATPFDLGEIKAFLPDIIFTAPTVYWTAFTSTLKWDTTALIGGATSAFHTKYARFIDTNLAPITINMPDIYLPGIDLLSFFPDLNFDFSLPGLPSLPSINISLPDIGLPGQTTVSFQQGVSDYMDAMKKPGSALRFPIWDDPTGEVIKMLSGEPADLIIFQPSNLRVTVGFRVMFPIYPPLFGGIGGEIKLEAALTMGFDTYGLTEFAKSHRVADIFDGFYFGDNIVNGVDKPEITLTTKLYAFAELNVGFARGGVQGGIKLVGTLDLYDENKDNHFRANEILAAVSDDPLDVVEMHLRGSAYISAYIELFAIFDWVTVFEYTFVDVTLFTWEHDPAAKKPILGSMDGSVLTLHMGNTIGSIDGQDAVTKGASDRLRRDTTDGNENFTLTQEGGLKVSALLPNGQTYTKTFSGVTKVKAYGGAGDDIVDAHTLDSSVSVEFIAGGGTDRLYGGAGNDVLIGSDTGTAYLEGNAGDDLFILRGGVAHVIGGLGNDTFRFLSGFGTVDITDTSGANILDFTAQTLGVTFDDSQHQAIQGTNTVTWHVSDTVDQVWGGKGDDVLDFSGDAANLLATLTGMNAGWVTGSASGMTQAGLTASTAMATAGDNGGFGFKFKNIENFIGGQGSDVVRVRDGAALTGSIDGSSTGGLHAANPDTGGDAPNARNTIDFSEYTTSVVVNEEGTSSFGSTYTANIIVRGFHNIFGGAGGDTLTGDGRNNLIVGNDGNDTLAGQAGHDLLVADYFQTWGNDLTTPVTVVKDYLSLTTAGIEGGFVASGSSSSAGRMWIWKGQTLENLQGVSGGKQTLKGGSGNDILMGALGNDVFNIGGSGEGDDTIMGDLGTIVVDFASRLALEAWTNAGAGGGADTIYLGTGNNLVLAGAAGDTIIGTDKAGSTNIILGDNGHVKFKTAKFTLLDRTTFAGQDGFGHMLDYVTTLTDETNGGKDTINLSNGSALVIGGKGDDTVTFTAGTSTDQNFRFIAGDHANVETDARGGITKLYSTDTLDATGGADTITVGNFADKSDRFLGRDFIIGGVGSDTILISAGFANTTDTVLTYGRAQSDDVILGDNGVIERYASIAPVSGNPSVINILKQVKSTDFTTTVGVTGDDTIVAGNGDKTIIGGFGSDTITIAAYGADTESGTPQSVATRIISGDNAQIDFDTAGGMTDFVTTDTQAVTGGRDVIRIGKVGSTTDLGVNFVIGGMGSDDIFVGGTFDTATAKIVAGSTTSSDVLLGDNGQVHRTALTNKMLSVSSLQVDKGGDDRIVSGNGEKVVIGGFGNDMITAVDGTMLALGDNGAFTYDGVAKNGVLRVAENTDTAIGGADIIQMGEGYKLVMGGFGADTITIDGTMAGLATGLAVVTGIAGLINTNALTGAALTAAQTENKGRTGRYVVGDNAKATFDVKGGLSDVVSTDAITATGAEDTITLGARDTTADLGFQLVIGGMGGDTITVRNGSTSNDVLLGDSGEFHRQALGYGILKIGSLASDKGGEDSITTGQGEKIIIGGFAGDTINVATKSASNHSIVLGDSGVLSYDLGGAGLLQKIESTDIGFGGNDSVTVGDGELTFIGGYGADALNVNSTTRNDRVAVGDNATLLFGADMYDRPVLTNATTTDQSGATGDGDVMRIGPIGGITGDMGRALLIGGMGSDTMTVTGATANVVMIGDNVDLARRFSSPDSGLLAGQLLSVTSLLLDQGAGDVMTTVSGDTVLVGGAGGDTIRAGSGNSITVGDSASLVFDSSGSGKIRLAASLGLTQGGSDNISLGQAGATSDGDKVVIGGGGADTINILSVAGTAALGEPRASSTSNPERAIAGDNASLRFDVSGRLTDFGTLDADVSTGGDDQITVIMSGDGLPGNPMTDFNVIAGGVGADSINVVGATKSRDVLAGDNLDFRRTDGSSGDPAKRYVSLFADVLQPDIGGNDTIRTGGGDKLVLGGAGNDSIETQTFGAADRNVVLGDAGTIVFDAAGSGKLLQIFTTGESSGGNDNITVGGGTSYVAAGLGSDTVTLNTADASNRILLGDNGQINFTNGLPTFVQTTGNDSVDASVSSDTFIVPGNGAPGQTVMLGGPGNDTVTGGNLANDVRLPGSGSVDLTDPLNTVISVTVLGEYGEMGITHPYLGEPGVTNPLVKADPNAPGGVGTIVGTITGEGAVTEDGTLTVTGKLGLAAINGGPATFPASVTAGTYGSLTLSTSGAWSYQLANAQANVQGLKAGDSRTDTFVLTTTDGSSTVVTITVLGADDAATIGGAATGSIAEGTVPSLTGALTVADADAGQASFKAATAVSAYGLFTLAADGTWTYSLDNAAPALKALVDGEQVQDVFAVLTRDGTAGSVNITINGVNNVAVIGGDTAASVQEDGSLQAAGQLTVDDGDAGQASFQAAVIEGAYGTLNLGAAGAWTYVLANDKANVQALAAGQKVTDTFGIASADGTGASITISVYGADDAPTGGTGGSGGVGGNGGTGGTGGSGGTGGTGGATGGSGGNGGSGTNGEAGAQQVSGAASQHEPQNAGGTAALLENDKGAGNGNYDSSGNDGNGSGNGSGGTGYGASSGAAGGAPGSSGGADGSGGNGGSDTSITGLGGDGGGFGFGGDGLGVDTGGADVPPANPLTFGGSNFFNTGGGAKPQQNSPSPSNQLEPSMGEPDGPPVIDDSQKNAPQPQVQALLEDADAAPTVAVAPPAGGVIAWGGGEQQQQPGAMAATLAEPLAAAAAAAALLAVRASQPGTRIEWGAPAAGTVKQRQVKPQTRK